MNVYEYWRILRRRARTILVVGLAGAVVGLVLALTGSTSYEAGSELYVTLAPGTPANDVNSSATLVQNQMTAYASLARSPMVLDPVVKQLSLPTDSTALSEEVSAASPAGTTLLTITVNDSSATQAAAIANAISQQMVTRVADFSPTASDGKTKTLRAYVSTPAVAPKYPAGSSKRTQVALGLVVGLVLGVLVALLREFLASRLRGQRELESMGVSTLAEIKRPVGRRDEQEATFDQLLDDVREASGSARPVVVVTSTTSTEGTATVTRGLSDAAARAGQRVLVVSPESSAPALPQGTTPGGDLKSVLDGDVSLGKAVQHSTSPRIDHLRSSDSGATTGPWTGPDLVAGFAVQARKAYDLTVIDLPEVLRHAEVAALGGRTDGVLLVLSTDLNRKADVVQAVDLLKAGSATMLGAVLTDANTPRNSRRDDA